MATHWYDLEGNCHYEIKKVNSTIKRATTLADAKKYNWFPGVTGILSLVSKPFIETWKLNILLKEASKIPNSDFLEITEDKEKVNQWKKEVLDKATITWNKASKRGTEVHDKLERYFKYKLVDEKDKDLLVPVISKLHETFPEYHWESEKSFGHKLGFGGKVDLIGRNKKNIVILDFKTKEKGIVDKTCLYFDYCIQLAAYRLGLKLAKARCYNVVISSIVPGQIYLHEWSELELNKGLKQFKVLVTLWKLINNIK